MSDDLNDPRDQTDPAADDLDERLRSGFDSIARAAGDPSPLPDRPDAPLPSASAGAGRRLLVAAAIVLVAALGAAVVVAVTDEDGPEQLRAGSETTTSTGEPEPQDRKVPAPAEHGALLCPPALLDLSRIEATPKLVPPTDNDAMGATAWPYELSWEQDGRTVRLSYPYPTVSNLAIREQETITLADGRTALVEGDTNPTAYVSPDAPDPDAEVGAVRYLDCTGFSLAVSSDDDDDAAARAVLLDAAEGVRLHAPPGTVEVPDVVGMAQVDAQDALARAGLIPATQPWAHSRDDARPVESQSPSAGTEAPYGTGVRTPLGPEPTTTQPPPLPLVPVDALPLPKDPLVCPISRLRVDGGFRSQPTVPFKTTIEWLQDGEYGGYLVQLSWPNRTASGVVISEPDPTLDGHGMRELTIGGRPALMHDGGDGQNLVYDTGLPGACRFLEVGVYGGGSIPERERRAEELASAKITFAPPPSSAPPDVTGLTVAAVADRLARAGFIPDWGEERAINDEPDEVPTAVVTSQAVSVPGAVTLTS